MVFDDASQDWREVSSDLLAPGKDTSNTLNPRTSHHDLASSSKTSEVCISSSKVRNSHETPVQSYPKKREDPSTPVGVKGPSQGKSFFKWKMQQMKEQAEEEAEKGEKEKSTGAEQVVQMEDEERGKNSPTFKS